MRAVGPLPVGPLPLLLVTFLVAACASDDATSGAATSTTGATGSGGASGPGGAGGGGGSGGSGPDPSAICEELGLPVREFANEPYGTHRGEVADDFTLELADGTSWNLRAHFSGCESYVFVPDSLPVSELDPASVWESDKDVASLLETSPQNVHYFFVSRKSADADAQASISGMKARLEGVLAAMDADASAHWRERVHVAAKRALDIDGWVGDVITSHGRIGFGIDRLQRIRGAGHLADVKRYNAALNSAMKWPWKSNLAYAAHEPQYYNAEAILQDRLDAEAGKVVTLWSGETLAELADIDVTLPSAAEMAELDSLEVEVTQQCPDPDEIELGNCGAWDYLAYLYVEDGPDNWVELARFITSYHRETHWVEDVSQMLPKLAAGGARKFRWSFAPSWNTQPTATHLSLRLFNQGKPVKPAEATFLWSGGPFGSGYDATHPPVMVPIPAAAKKVELWTIVTGHGSGTGSCAEFCNHQHEITVNAASYLKEFPEASTNDGCIAQVEHGMTPNQAGTWWFGRGGWCPGQQVDPWVVDVTADVVPGETATLSYKGMLGGKAPPDGAGDIALISYLVVHE